MRAQKYSLESGGMFVHVDVFVHVYIFVHVELGVMEILVVH